MPEAATGADASPPTTRVVAVMEMLAAAPTSTFTLARICRELAISRATGHAIMQTLANRDWVIRENGSGEYGVSPTLGVFGHREHDVRSLSSLAQATSVDLGMPASLAEMRGQSVIITETRGDSHGNPAGGMEIVGGLTLPFVAPFGREYAAWATPAVQRRWFDSLPGPGPVEDRMIGVLEVIRRRGYVVDRLSRPLIRVYTALRALGDDLTLDEISTALARVCAELVVDVTDAEMAQAQSISVATISAPIAVEESETSRSIAVQPFRHMLPDEIAEVGAHLRVVATQASALLREAAAATR